MTEDTGAGSAPFSRGCGAGRWREETNARTGLRLFFRSPGVLGRAAGAGRVIGGDQAPAGLDEPAPLKGAHLQDGGSILNGFEGDFRVANFGRFRTSNTRSQVCFWLQAAVRAMPPIRLLNLQQQTFERRSPLSPRFRLLHPQVRTSRAMPPFVWF